MSKHGKCEAGRGGLSVAVRNGDAEKAIKKLKKMVLLDGILKEVKAKSEFVKPSVVKRLRKIEARRAHKKAEALRLRHDGF